MRLSFDHARVIREDTERMIAWFGDVFGGEAVCREENFHAPGVKARDGSAKGLRPACGHTSRASRFR